MQEAQTGIEQARGDLTALQQQTLEMTQRVSDYRAGTEDLVNAVRIRVSAEVVRGRQGDIQQAKRRQSSVAKRLQQAQELQDPAQQAVDHAEELVEVFREMPAGQQRDTAVDATNEACAQASEAVSRLRMAAETTTEDVGALQTQVGGVVEQTGAAVKRAETDLETDQGNRRATVDGIRVTRTELARLEGQARDANDRLENARAEAIPLQREFDEAQAALNDAVQAGVTKNKRKPQQKRFDQAKNALNNVEKKIAREEGTVNRINKLIEADKGKLRGYRRQLRENDYAVRLAETKVRATRSVHGEALGLQAGVMGMGKQADGLNRSVQRLAGQLRVLNIRVDTLTHGHDPLGDETGGGGEDDDRDPDGGDGDKKGGDSSGDIEDGEYRVAGPDDGYERLVDSDRGIAEGEYRIVGPDESGPIETSPKKDIGTTNTSASSPAESPVTGTPGETKTSNPLPPTDGAAPKPDTAEPEGDALSPEQKLEALRSKQENILKQVEEATSKQDALKDTVDQLAQEQARLQQEVQRVGNEDQRLSERVDPAPAQIGELYLDVGKMTDENAQEVTLRAYAYQQEMIQTAQAAEENNNAAKSLTVQVQALQNKVDSVANEAKAAQDLLNNVKQHVAELETFAQSTDPTISQPAQDMLKDANAAAESAQNYADSTQAQLQRAQGLAQEATNPPVTKLGEDTQFTADGARAFCDEVVKLVQEARRNQLPAEVRQAQESLDGLDPKATVRDVAHLGGTRDLTDRAIHEAEKQPRTVENIEMLQADIDAAQEKNTAFGQEAQEVVERWPAARGQADEVVGETGRARQNAEEHLKNAKQDQQTRVDAVQRAENEVTRLNKQLADHQKRLDEDGLTSTLKSNTENEKAVKRLEGEGKGSIKEAEKKLAAKQAELEAHRLEDENNVAQATADLEAAKNIDEQAQAVQNKLEEAVDKAKKLQGDVEPFQERIDKLQAEVDRLKREKDDGGKDGDGKGPGGSSLEVKAKVEDATSEVKQAIAHVEDTTTEALDPAKTQTVDQMQTAHDTLKQKVSDLETATDVPAKDLTGFQEASEQASAEAATRLDAANKSAGELSGLKQQLEEINNKIAETQGKLTKLRDRWNSIGSKLEEEEGKLTPDQVEQNVKPWTEDLERFEVAKKNLETQITEAEKKIPCDAPEELAAAQKQSGDAQTLATDVRELEAQLVNAQRVQEHATQAMEQLEKRITVETTAQKADGAIEAARTATTEVEGGTAFGELSTRQGRVQTAIEQAQQARNPRNHKTAQEIRDARANLERERHDLETATQTARTELQNKDLRNVSEQARTEAQESLAVAKQNAPKLNTLKEEQRTLEEGVRQARGKVRSAEGQPNTAGNARKLKEAKDELRDRERQRDNGLREIQQAKDADPVASQALERAGAQVQQAEDLCAKVDALENKLKEAQQKQEAGKQELEHLDRRLKVVEKQEEIATALGVKPEELHIEVVEPTATTVGGEVRYRIGRETYTEAQLRRVLNNDAELSRLVGENQDITGFLEYAAALDVFRQADPTVVDETDYNLPTRAQDGRLFHEVRQRFADEHVKLEVVVEKSSDPSKPYTIKVRDPEVVKAKALKAPTVLSIDELEAMRGTTPRRGQQHPPIYQKYERAFGKPPKECTRSVTLKEAQDYQGEVAREFARVEQTTKDKTAVLETVAQAVAAGGSQDQAEQAVEQMPNTRTAAKQSIQKATTEQEVDKSLDTLRIETSMQVSQAQGNVQAATRASGEIRPLKTEVDTLQTQAEQSRLEALSVTKATAGRLRTMNKAVERLTALERNASPEERPEIQTALQQARDEQQKAQGEFDASVDNLKKAATVDQDARQLETMVDERTQQATQWENEATFTRVQAEVELKKAQLYDRQVRAGRQKGQAMDIYQRAEDMRKVPDGAVTVAQQDAKNKRSTAEAANQRAEALVAATEWVSDEWGDWWVNEHGSWRPVTLQEQREGLVNEHGSRRQATPLEIQAAKGWAAQAAKDWRETATSAVDEANRWCWESEAAVSMAWQSDQVQGEVLSAAQAQERAAQSAVEWLTEESLVALKEVTDAGGPTKATAEQNQRLQEATDKLTQAQNWLKEAKAAVEREVQAHAETRQARVDAAALEGQAEHAAKETIQDLTQAETHEIAMTLKDAQYRIERIEQQLPAGTQIRIEAVAPDKAGDPVKLKIADKEYTHQDLHQVLRNPAQEIENIALQHPTEQGRKEGMENAADGFLQAALYLEVELGAVEGRYPIPEYRQSVEDYMRLTVLEQKLQGPQNRQLNGQPQFSVHLYSDGQRGGKYALYIERDNPKTGVRERYSYADLEKRRDYMERPGLRKQWKELEPEKLAFFEDYYRTVGSSEGEVGNRLRALGLPRPNALEVPDDRQLLQHVEAQRTRLLTAIGHQFQVVMGQVTNIGNMIVQEQKQERNAALQTVIGTTRSATSSQ